MDSALRILLLTEHIALRAGANENTTISFEHDVKSGRSALKAGMYGLFMAMGADNVTIIFSTQSEAGVFITMLNMMHCE